MCRRGRRVAPAKQTPAAEWKTYRHPAAGLTPEKDRCIVPHFADEGDRLTQRVIERWKLIAASEVDDIGGWREHTHERYEWGPAPDRFYSHTTHLVGWITSRFPKLDPTPLQDVYGAVTAWHDDHNDSRVPPQTVLFATLDRAMTVVNAVEMDLHSRLVHEQGATGQDTPGADGAPPPAREERCAWIAKAMLLVRDNPKWPDARIAKAVGKNPGTLSRCVEYKTAAAMARGDKSLIRRGHVEFDPDANTSDVVAYTDENDS